MHLVAVGPGVQAAQAVIARLLASSGEHPLLILDYQGVAERILEPADVARMEAASVTWIDLGELARPVRLLDVRPGSPSKALFDALLHRFARILALPLEQADIDDARTFAGRLLGSGECRTMTLANVRAAMLSNELLHWAWPAGAPAVANEPDARRDRLRAVLDGTLRFAHLAAIAAAPSIGPDVGEPMPRWIWIEIPRRHVEPVEWFLLAAVLHSLAELAGGQQEDARKGGDVARRIPVLLYPPADPLLLPLTPIAATAGSMIIATNLHPSGRPPILLRDMVSRGEPVRVELASPPPLAALGAWNDVAKGCLPDKSSTAPLAFQVTAERVETPQPRLLWNNAASPHGLARVRDEGRRLRRTLAQSHIASAVVPATALNSGGRDPFDRLCSPSTLLLAWSALAAARGSDQPGIDNVRPHAFSSGLRGEIDALATELRHERYQPMPPRWVTIPKPSGGARRIGITTVRDRVAQRSFVYVSEPFFEPHFSDRSFAFRPNRSAHHAIMAALAAIGNGFAHVGHVDIRSCFDQLPHEIVLSRYGERIPSPRMLSLLARWLRFGFGADEGIDALGVGVVQGWVMSPFLSNVVLDDLDSQLEKRGVEFLRFADDLALFAHSERGLQEVIEMVDQLLATRLHLRLNPEKTQIGTVDAGCDYLGFRIGGQASLAIAPGRFLEMQANLVAMTHALVDLRTGSDASAAIERIGQQVDGLAGYFCRLGVTQAMEAQLAALRQGIEDERANLPPEVQSLPQWTRIPMTDELVRRYGRIDHAMPRADAPAPAPYDRVGDVVADDWRLARPASEPLAPASPGPGSNDVARSAGSTDVCPLVDRDGATLHVLRGGVGIYADDLDLIIRRQRHELFRAPLSEVELILVQAFGVHFSSRTAWSLAGHGVSVVMACPAGDDIAVLAPPGGARAHVRVAQVRVLGSPPLDAAALGMLVAKIANQASVLRYLARAPGRRDGGTGAQLVEAAVEIRRIDDQLRTLGLAATSVDRDRVAQWMGHEGRAAARYWTALSKILPPELEFPGRRTRKATDPVNHALNYAYGFLYGDIWRAVARTGLDPGIGLFHAAPRSPGGLVYDLIEELRAPLVDRLVFSLIGRGWRPASRAARDGMLTAASRQLLARAYRAQRRRRLRRGRSEVRIGDLPQAQANALLSLVLGDTSSYPPFHFRW